MYELLQKHKQLKIQQKELEKQVKKFCQDKRNPIDQRWELYETCGFGEDKDWVWHWDKRDGIMDSNLNDGESIRRGSTVNIPEQIELTQEWTQEPSPEYIESIKELVLKTWIKTYKFDW